MKLYFFNPNDYGAEYSVLASNKKDAIAFLIQYFKNNIAIEEEKIKNGKEGFPNGGRSDLSMWENASPNNLPDSYTIDEYEEGKIIETYNG